jgi:glycosyltransferase involved in cell wall biosynthesis
MLVRVVEYVASAGGGHRFVAEMLGAFRRVTTARFEVVSHGQAFRTYERLLGSEFPVRDLAPVNAFRVRPPWAGKPGARLLNAILGTADFHFDVPDVAFEGCDLVWFPWVHRHRATGKHPERTFATFHDCTSIDFPGILSERWRRDETVTTRGWLASSARIIVTSNATISTMDRLFSSVHPRPTVVPLSSKHDRPAPSERPRTWPFSDRPYLLCPTNITPHKNLEGLLEGFATWGAKVPLVITGSGTDLRDLASPRQRQLRQVIERRGLVRDRDLFTLGYVSDADYYAILDGAWALAMPTLAEGGGSFPVMEAMEQGIPVLSSDIPVMREMGERWNGRLIWFDARSPSDIAAKLSLLESGYEEHRRLARAQVSQLLQRSWDDVAREYANIMGLEPRAVRAAGPA